MTTPTAVAREVLAVERILDRLARPAALTLAELDDLDQRITDAEDVAARRLPAGFRRRLLPHERAAGVLFADVDAAQDRTAEQLAAITGAAREQYATALGELIAALPAAERPGELDKLGNPNRVSPLAAAAGRTANLDGRRAELVEVLLDHRTRAAKRLAGELAAQTGRPATTPPGPTPAEVDLIATRAADLILAAIAPITDLAAGYAARARAVTTLAEDDDDLVGRLRRDLNAAAAKAERGRLADARAAAQQTEGTARITAAPALGRIANVYASELLDRNTCQPCAAVDGRDYGTLDEARVDYPLGTYVDCDGGARCRGTLVIVWGSEAPPTRGQPPPDAGPRAPRTPRDDGPPAVLDPALDPRVAPPAAAGPAPDVPAIDAESFLDSERRVILDDNGEPDLTYRVVAGEDGEIDLVTIDDRPATRGRTTTDLDHVYRVVSAEDYERMRTAGFLDTSGRYGHRVDGESVGMVASAAVSRGQLLDYAADGDHGIDTVVLRIRVEAGDGWVKDTRDGVPYFVANRTRVPFDRVERRSRRYRVVVDEDDLDDNGDEVRRLVDTEAAPRPPAPKAAPLDLTDLTDDELADLVPGLADDEDALARVFAELDRRDELAAAPPPAAAPAAAPEAAELRRQISAAYADDDYDLAADLGRQLDELEGPDESWAAWEGQADAGEVLDAARRDVREQADRFLADLGIDLPSPEERAAGEAARAVERAAKARRPPGRLRDRLTAEWQEHAELLYMNSENDDDVRGVLLRKDRMRELREKYGANVNLTYLLYTQPMHVSSYYASDELLAYWRADPTRRMTLSQYLRAGGVKDRKTLAAAAAADSAFDEAYTKDRRKRPKRGRG